MHIYSIQDIKAEGFNRPFFSATKFTAMREISLGLRKDESMNIFAPDFALWELGTFDAASGKIMAHNPVIVCQVSDLTEKEDDAS